MELSFFCLLHKARRSKKYFLTFVCMSVASLLAHATVNAEIKKQTLVNHIFLMQELKECIKNKKNAVEVVQPTTEKKLLTPTQAYLSIPELKNGIENQWRSALQEHKKMIDTFIAREQEFQDTHYVFYHGQNGSFRIFQDFLKEWFRLMHIKEDLTEFDMLRIWDRAALKADANGFLDKYNGDIDNYRPDIQEVILSVNLSLFANLYDSSACSFHYFTNNYSMRPPNIRGLVEQVFTEYGIDHKYIDKLFKIALEENRANLLQIFIPKELVDQCTYLAIRGGKPNRNKIVSSCFDSKKGWHTKISPILELYQSNPSALSARDLDLLQGRIVLSQDIMLNPDSGVKIYRHTPIDEAKLSEYQQKIKTFTKKVFAKNLTEMTKINKKTNLVQLLRLFTQIVNFTQVGTSSEKIKVTKIENRKNHEKISELFYKEKEALLK